jgi:hypothetical protein
MFRSFWKWDSTTDGVVGGKWIDGFIVNAECWYAKLSVEVRDPVVLEMMQRPLIDHHAADVDRNV